MEYGSTKFQIQESYSRVKPIVMLIISKIWSMHKNIEKGKINKELLSNIPNYYTNCRLKM